MSFKSFIKNTFGTKKIPTGPTADQLYSGPAAFSGYGGAQAEVKTNQAATDALAQMQGIAATGWTSADRQAQAQSAREAASQEQGQRGAVEQQAAMRGQSGGGTAMMGALAAQQGGANRAASTAASIASQGADRRFQAGQAAGQMGMAMTGLDMQRAGSIDQFNQWASGMQQNATQGAYENQMAKYDAQAEQSDRWWSRMTGGNGFTGG